MKIALIILFTSWCATSGAQVTHWEKAGLPVTAWQVRCSFVDTTTHELYVGGGLLRTTNVFDSLTLCIYNGSVWDTLGNFNDVSLCITRFNSDLIVGGFFSMVNGVPVHHLTRFDGTTWHEFGNFNHTVWQVKVIDGELYATGQFDTVNSLPIHGIAKWTGTAWTDVNAFPWNEGSAIDDVAKYNGELYVCGNFNIGGVEDMMYYHNGSWQEVGVVFGGFLNWVNRLEILNGELYAGGSINLGDGNVGNGIQKWNGSSWSPVGDNLQDLHNGYANRIEVFDMTIHNNELYCVGLFEYAGHVSAKYLAKWTGSQWCGFGSAVEFNQPAYGVTFYDDTMYVRHAIDTINGEPTEYLIKWIAGNYVDTCSAPIGIDEYELPSYYSFYPNPATSFLIVNSNSFEPIVLIITDVLGRQIRSIVLSKNAQTIDISNLSSGIYNLMFINQRTTQVQKFLKE